MTVWPTQSLLGIELNGCACELTEIAPLHTSSGEEIFAEGGFAMCPDGSMYVHAFGELFTVDPGTGLCTIVPGLPLAEFLSGLACAGNGILYGVEEIGHGNILYQYDLNAVTVTALGSLPYSAHAGMFYLNDDLYLLAPEGVVLVDTLNPANSTLLFSWPLWYEQGGTVYGSCNSLLIYTDNFNFAFLSLLDGSIVELGCTAPYNTIFMASLNQYLPPGPCTLQLDLDCNDSSGAVGADFNSPVFTCLTPSGVPIGDDDIVIFGDAIMDQMTVTISPAYMPDGADEILDVNMAIPNLNVSGAGSSTLIFTNTSGTATFNDFIDALHATVYINTSPQFTPGIRSVVVEYTNVDGVVSDLATAFINVVELPLIQVTLGPDLILCDGDSPTLNAGNPGSTYLWSTQQTTQTITVTETDIYSVTVSNDIDCPNADTVALEILPVIDIALIGDLAICDNEIANLTITLNTSIPVSIEIESSTGSTFAFADLTGNHSFTDPITGYTEYELTTIEPSSPACIHLADSTHAIEVFPTYQTFVDTSICEGDSVWLGTYWQTNAGTYGSTYPSANGCDSIVTTHIEILPEVMIFYQRDTCDANAAGVFITLLENPNGCDTIIQTTISLLPSDTTNFTLTTCVSSQADIDIDTLTNAIGCDSLLITTTIYQPPTDTTYLSLVTCDSALLGIYYDTLLSTNGCDSIVALAIQYASIDTTHSTGQSCIPANIGVFTTVFTDTQGCDSVVIRTVTSGTPDTTSLFQTSCDPASLGVFEDLLISAIGCDSMIITTITFSAQDSTFLSAATCDPLAAGVFVSSYTNQFGCDSIVTETIALNISHQISITSSSCMPSETGVFTYQLINQFGCDSIVTETVSLLPANQTQLTETTCHADQAGTFITAHFNQYGCDSTVTRVVNLVAADTTRLNYYTCDANEVEQTENIYISADGCDSLVIETTTLFPLPIVTVEAVADYNGFDISCHGYADGSAIANINGIAPFTYVWSTTSPDQMITGLSEGAYSVAITDGNGCETSGLVTLTEPDLLMLAFEISEPGCFDHDLGIVSAIVTGGVMPYLYSLDGGPYQADPHFNSLGEGVYMISVLDANDCVASEIIAIDIPLTVTVSLGENQLISLGDSTTIEAIINLPFDSLASIDWNGINNIDCPNCLTQLIAPIITTAYSITVTSADGCADQDSVTITVSNDQSIYIPNIFSPNGDGVNDVLTISTDLGVKEISLLSIFDRWGNLVFNVENMFPEDPALAWDGKMNETMMNPGVFTYKIVILYANGNSELRYGDVTLMR